MKTTYQVEGMHCPDCEHKVGDALRGVPGVERVEVSLETGGATVEMDGPVDASQLRQRVAEAGDYRLHAAEEHIGPASAMPSPNGASPPGGQYGSLDANKVEHQAEAQRFVMYREGRESSLNYDRLADNVIAMSYVFVPPQDRNQGIAEALTRHALQYADQHGLRVIPECIFVRKFIARYQEFQPLVAGGR